jgi:hypothetical protein
VNRTEFDSLRDLKDKIIRGDIRFSQREPTRPFFIADVFIENSSGHVLRLMIRFNPEVGSKTFAVDIQGIGPICRLDIDGHNHPPVGRNHKHSLQTERCPNRNLPDGAIAYDNLSGQSVRVCFEEFCRVASIAHDGQFYAPDEGI